MAKLRLGELLISKGLLSKEQFNVAMSQQGITGKLLGDTLIKLGFVSSLEMGQTLAEQAGIEFIDLSRYAINEEALRMVPRETAESVDFIPFDLKDGTLSIGITNPSNIRAIDTASRISGKPPSVFMVDTDALQEMIERAYYFLAHPVVERIKAFTSELQDGAELSGNMISNLTELLTMDAIRRDATDVHITPAAETLHVFYRVDGVLQHTFCLPLVVHNGIVSRLKILSNLDIAEQRLPQDGSFSFPIMNKNYEMRLSVIPTIYGENAVIRILGGTGSLLSIAGLGFDKENTNKLHKVFSKPYGLIIVAGPTGSGKTTTLYSALREINIIERNVLTVEDPVEYKLSMIKQTQVSSKSKYDFALAGRSFMRQDPDAMLIGEIRDEETASIAVRAAITGHLVLSTIHTNDAVTVIPRFIDLGVDSFLLSSALLVVIAQRLVRKVCNTCAQPRSFTQEELDEMGFGSLDTSSFKTMHGSGCDACSQTGYLGRTLIGEILIINDEIKELIYGGGSIGTIIENAIKNGMKTMRDNGIMKVSEGITTFEEVLRVVG